MVRKRSESGNKPLSRRRAGEMLRDIFEARHDLNGLAEAYGLTPSDLAAWANEDENRDVLHGLCVLADLQTQLMLSRYRQLAVTELIRQATGKAGDDGGSVSPEQARKACVDLLRADLKPMGASSAAKRGDSDVALSEPESSMVELKTMRDTLYQELTGQSLTEPDD